MKDGKIVIDVVMEDGISDGLGTIIKAINKSLSKLKKITDILKKVSKMAAQVTSTILKLAQAFTALAKSIMLLTGAIAAITLLATAITWAYQNIKIFREAVDSTFMLISQIVKVTMMVFQGFLDMITTFVQGITVTIASTIVTIVENIAVVIAATVTGIVQNVTNSVTQIIMQVISATGTLASIVTETIMNVAGQIYGYVNDILNHVQSIMAMIPLLIQVVMQAVVGVIRLVYDLLGGTVMDVLGGSVIEALDKIIEALDIIEVISPALERIVNRLTDPWYALKNIIGGTCNFAKHRINDMISDIVDMGNTLINVLNKVIKIMNKIPGINLPNIPKIPKFKGLRKGTNNWEGGFAYMNESDRGELVHLPNGAKVIPHDVSVSYAKEAAKRNAVLANRSVLDTKNAFIQQTASATKLFAANRSVSSNTSGSQNPQQIDNSRHETFTIINPGATPAQMYREARIRAREAAYAT